MAIRHKEGEVGVGKDRAIRASREHDRQQRRPRLRSEQVWKAIAKPSFAYLSCVTPSGEPRSSGVCYKVIEGRLCVAVAPNSWKARYIAANGRVAVTVPVRRGGLLSLVAPIPPATVSFHGEAIVHPTGSAQARTRLKEMGSLVPPERRASGSIVEVLPEGQFLTYGLGVSLRKMLDPTGALERVAVS